MYMPVRRRICSSEDRVLIFDSSYTPGLPSAARAALDRADLPAAALFTAFAALTGVLEAALFAGAFPVLAAALASTPLPVGEAPLPGGEAFAGADLAALAPAPLEALPDFFACVFAAIF
jgi:hypothetical protein